MPIPSNRSSPSFAVATECDSIAFARRFSFVGLVLVVHPPLVNVPRSNVRSVCWIAIRCLREFVLGSLLLLVLGATVFGAGGVVSAQPRSVHADVIPSTRSVAIGERFTLSVVVEHGFQSEVIFPAPDAGPMVFGPLDVVDRQDVRSRYLGASRPGMRVDSVVYTVAAFGIDSVRVPRLPVQLVTGQDTTLVGMPAPHIRVVSTVGPDAAQLKGLAPLASFPQPLWPWMLLGLVVVLLVAGAAYAWWYRGSEAAPLPPDEVLTDDRTPYERAEARLERLYDYDVADPAVRSPYHVDLARLVRVYLAERLDVNAPNRTTREVIAALRAHDAVSAEAAARVQSVLEQADLVKFANARPDPDVARQAQHDAQRALAQIEQACIQNSTSSEAPTAASQS